MAMQNSNELAEAARILYHEFGKLGIKSLSCGYMFIDENKLKQTAWVTLPDGTILPNFIDFPPTGDHVLNERYESWKMKQPLHVCTIQGEINTAHHQFLSQHVPENVAKDIFAHISDSITFYGANFSNGYLLILAPYLFSPDEELIIVRFARVFELTYTRFLDLKLAEAKAREAQIELALERVRSKTLAMQSSDELSTIIGLIYQELG
jgi:hypothetical protein